MSFGKLVALSMMAAFSATAGFSYLSGNPASETEATAQPVAFMP